LSEKMTPHDLSTPPSPAVDPEEVRLRKMNRRAKVIQELVQTEKDYLTDLELCIREVVDIDRLFTNMETVCEVSAALLHRLHEAMADPDLEAVVIGNAVLTLAKAALEDVYKIYCYHHDDANMSLKSYEKEEEIKQHFTTCIIIVVGKPNLLDMGSLLIKPVQRIMKYPLLLRELWQATPEDHPDYRPLQEAFTTAKIINVNINEFKRRKDIVMKYKRLEDEGTLRGKLNKINIHSIRKKGDRFVFFLFFFYGSLHNHYNQADYCCKSLFIFCYLIDFFLQKDSMERLVLVPLSSLQGMFTAPQKLIQKRYDKLLDYCSRLEQDPPGPARRDYEAINALLVEELQRFNMAAYTILTNCVVYLVALLRELMDRILLRAPSMQQLPVRILHVHTHYILTSYIYTPLRRAVLQMLEVQHQTEEQRAWLLAEYPLSRLYQLKRKCNGCQEQDLSLLEGELVALLEDTDPLGSSSRWLVHTGGKCVYVCVHAQGQRPLRQRYAQESVPGAPVMSWLLFYAVYAFQARCDQELTLQESQHVRILQFCDLGGNKEWWLAEANGQKGYVPANYLGWYLPFGTPLHVKS
uniref:Rho guanine nucleotide exchange factor 38 n=1 Tax=Seriola dumerili TaxID=41447 RepID=A0A3B4TAQ7_SERDU